MKHLPEAVLTQPISGLNLHGASLSAELGRQRTLLVFLRHFG